MLAKKLKYYEISDFLLEFLKILENEVRSIIVFIDEFPWLGTPRFSFFEFFEKKTCKCHLLTLYDVILFFI